MAGPLRALGRKLRNMVLPLVGYWHLREQLDAVAARLEALEAASRAEAEASREREARLVSALASELAAWLADPPMSAALQCRLDELAGELGHKTDLANEKLDRNQLVLLRLAGPHRDAPAPDLAAIREAVAREIDRLDLYLVHHAAELQAAIKAKKDVT